MEYLYHTTADGDEIAIVSMGDTHLLNTFQMILRKFHAAWTVSAVELDSVTQILHEAQQSQQKESAKRYITAMYQIMPHYLMELEIRGLVTDELRAQLQAAVGRSKQVSTPSYFLEEF
jgi:hypothetical protein